MLRVIRFEDENGVERYGEEAAVGSQTKLYEGNRYQAVLELKLRSRTQPQGGFKLSLRSDRKQAVCQISGAAHGR